MITVETDSAGFALLRHAAPERKNRLDVQTRRAIADTLDDLAAETAVRAVILAGSEECFAAGADIAEMAGVDATGMLAWNTAEVWDRIARFPKPLIAAVRGYALGGGCELAMHCDIIVAGAGSHFGQPEPRVGIMPGAGGTQRLTRAAGRFRASLYLMTGEPFSAEEARDMGLVSRVVPDAEVEPEARRIAERIAALPPLAMRFVKESIRMADNAPLDQALQFERRSCQFLFGTEDKQEGMAAFLGKRRPDFRGC